jgi:diacylglycerol kinase (ATP)
MKHFLVLNPASKSGTSRRRFKRIFSFLHQQKIEYDYELTHSMDSAYELSRWANRQGYDVIVAVGGDGTINRVLNGFYDDSGKRLSDASMGVLYTGTSPDFCKSYGIPHRLDSALKTLTEGRRRKIRVGKILLARHCAPLDIGKPVAGNRTFKTQYFACCTNIGLGAKVARYANEGTRKRLGDVCGTLLSLLRSLSECEQAVCSVALDGGSRLEERLTNLSVGKTRFVASGIRIENELKREDDRFYCLLIRKIDIWNLLPLIGLLYRGRRIKGLSFASLDYCRHIEIFGRDGSTEVEFDGDPQGFLPCRIEMAEERLDLIVKKDE